MDLTRIRFGKHRYFKNKDFNLMLAISHQPSTMFSSGKPNLLHTHFGQIGKNIITIIYERYKLGRSFTI